MSENMDIVPTTDEDLEDELSRLIASRRNLNYEGLLTLTRSLENVEVHQLDVDLTILDYLLYRATESVFEWRSNNAADPHSMRRTKLSTQKIDMTNSWMIFVEKHHGPAALDERTRFRARLLQFVLLFTHRYDDENTWANIDSLNDIREQNNARNIGIYSSQPAANYPPLDPNREFPLHEDSLEENRVNYVAYPLRIPDRWTHRGFGQHNLAWPSLHDLLYLFMKLTAARVDLGQWQTLSGWMNLAAEWMLQAVLEEYLLLGTSGEETFNKIFAFGCPVHKVLPGEDESLRMMRTLFCQSENPNEPIHGWTRMKRQRIEELLPKQNSTTSSVRTMEITRFNHPLQDFDNAAIDFLVSLHNSLEKPDLVQVEEGHITVDGHALSETETHDMFRRMGM